MFSLKKYCLAEVPNDHFLVCTFSWPPGNEVGDGPAPLVPDMDSVTGRLLIRDSTGIVVQKVPVLLKDYYGLINFFHLAMLHDGLYKFFVTGNLDIRIYLCKPLFVKAKWVPHVNIQDKKLAPLKTALAKNVQIHNDFCDMFQIELYGYQQNNVAWMINVENLVSIDCNLLEYPQLRELYLHRIQLGKEFVLYNFCTQHMYPTSYEDEIPNHSHHVAGGLLCDEVGLGKTFSMYGLIINTISSRQVQFWNRKPGKKLLLAEKAEWQEIPGPRKPGADDPTQQVTRFTSNATLIICPTRLTAQWLAELEKFMLPLHDLRVYTITSITNYRKLTAAELCNADIVIMSDRFLINGNYCDHTTEADNFGLHDFYWKRIIVDEGHEILVADQYTLSIPIRNRLYELQSKYRWICTGTPFPHDYYNFDHYLHFLTGLGYSLGDWEYFDTATVEQFLQQNTRKNKYENIKTQIFIPPITQITVLLTQNPVERMMYVNATGQTTRMIQLCTNILVSTVDASIIDDKITSLDEIRRQMSDHYQTEIDNTHHQIELAETERMRVEELYENAGNLYEIDTLEWRNYRTIQRTTIRKWTTKIKEYQDTIESMLARKKLFDNVEQRVKRDPCVICYDEMTDVVLTKCSHIFCRSCMDQVIKEHPRNIICPMCRTNLVRSTDIGYLFKQEDTVDESIPYYQHVQQWGTKMAWLVQHLEHVLRKSKNRVIIFSQWKKMLKLVGTVLEKVDIKHVYLQGSASQLARNINRFKTSPDLRTIMLSSETCSSGSNLTEASHIVLLDTVNGTAHQAKAIEDQAIGRAARLGQTKNVQVVRLIMGDTIEYDYYKENIEQENITEIQGGEGIYI